jgi:hypothetical protein
LSPADEESDNNDDGDGDVWSDLGSSGLTEEEDEEEESFLLLPGKTW